MTYCYYLVAILINAIYLGGVKYYKKYKDGIFVFFINLFFTFAFLSGGIYMNIRFVGKSIWVAIFIFNTNICYYSNYFENNHTFLYIY